MFYVISFFFFAIHRESIYYVEWLKIIIIENYYNYYYFAVQIFEQRAKRKRDIAKVSYAELFCKEGILKSFAKFTRKHLCPNLFFINLQTGGLLLYTSRRLLLYGQYSQHPWWNLAYVQLQCYNPKRPLNKEKQLFSVILNHNRTDSKGVIRTLSNIYECLFQNSFFSKKAPTEIFNMVLNTMMDILTKIITSFWKFFF